MNNTSNINDVANHDYTTLFLNRKYDVGSSVWIPTYIPIDRKWYSENYIVTGIIYTEPIFLPLTSVKNDNDNGTITSDNITSRPSLLYELFSPLTEKIITVPEDKIFLTPKACQEWYETKLSKLSF